MKSRFHILDLLTAFCILGIAFAVHSINEGVSSV